MPLIAASLLYVLDGTVTTVAGDGTAGFADGAATQARFNNPQGVAIDGQGVIYVADTGSHRIRRIAVDGTVTTVAGDGIAGLQNGQGTQARFNSPRGVAVLPSSAIIVADSANHVLRKILLPPTITAISPTHGAEGD